MQPRPCLRCRALSAGSYCPRHAPEYAKRTHLRALADGGDHDGQDIALCDRHHVQVSAAERKARIRSR